MEFRKLLEIVGDEPVFETGLLLSGDVDPVDVRRQLSRWTKSGKVNQIRRGLYALAPLYRKRIPHPFVVANKILPASYVSLQSALAFYGMIPEYVPVTTSVTTQRPYRWETEFGIFDFRHLTRQYFFGYQVYDLGDRQQAFVARPEKALLDLIYLEPGGEEFAFLAELRLQNLGNLDWERGRNFVRRFDKPKLFRALENLIELADQEEYEPL